MIRVHTSFHLEQSKRSIMGTKSVFSTQIPGGIVSLATGPDEPSILTRDRMGPFPQEMLKTHYPKSRAPWARILIKARSKALLGPIIMILLSSWAPRRVAGIAMRRRSTTGRGRGGAHQDSIRCVDPLVIVLVNLMPRLLARSPS